MSTNITFATMPIVSAINSELLGYEILLREYNSLSLDLFNRNIELYTEFSFELLQKILEIDATKKFRTENELLFINFTVKQLLSAGTLTFLIMAEEKNIKLHNIVIEITEREALFSDIHIKERILLFKRFGCQFAIDDFGAEHSNFKSVFELKPNFIKLDGEMVSQYCEANVPTLPLKKLVSLCHELDAKVIAEGVESIHIYNKLKEINVDYFQGYYLGKPELIFSS